MGIQGIRFGNLYGVGNVQPKEKVEAGVAQNFQNNYNFGELRPEVKNDVLANKLDLYA